MNIKQLLSETIPEDVSLTEREKAAIRQRVHVNNKTHLFRFLAPVAAATVLLLALVLFLPNLTQEHQPAFEIEHSVALPDIPYASLIPSIYIEQNDELIYTTSDGIYRYSFEEDISEKLFVTEQRIYDYVASEKWLAWKEDVNNRSTLHIVNRKTGKQNSLANDSISIMSLEGDKLVQSYSNPTTPSYWLLNLNSLEESLLHSSNKNGELGMLDHENGMIVLSERIEEATTLSVYSDETGELLYEFPSPYAAVHRLEIANDRIYGDFASEKEHMRFGFITLGTGEFTDLQAPEYWNSAIIGEYVALAIPNKRGIDLSDVELFKIQGEELVPVSKFPSIKERLVIPYRVGRDFEFFIEENFTSGGPTLHVVKP